MNSLNKLKNSLGDRAKLSNQAGNVAKKAMNTGAAIKDQMTNAAKQISNTVKEKVDVAKKQVSDVGQQPAVGKIGEMTQEFFNSNSAISTFVYFFLCVLLFVILFQFGIEFVMYLFGPQYNPYIINGMVSSDVQTVISANPNVDSSVPIYRSINEAQGVEFSWNVWFVVQDVTGISNTNGGALIFSKGKNTSTNISSKINNKYINVSPGVFLTPNSNENDLLIVLDTFIPNNTSSKNYYESITIPNIPMQKWVCCTIRVQGTYVDVYINGVLTKRTILINLPKQNYYDTYIGDTSGFKGYISSLRYYSKAISYDEIQSLFAAGPSLKMLNNTLMPPSSDFLSMNWYYNYKFVKTP